MTLNVRFAIISDPHVAQPTTIWDSPHRFHMVEVSIPALEQALDELSQLDLDFLLLPGDLTQHGEPENHQWLVDRLMQLPFPAYVVPGNHDMIQRSPTPTSIGADDFPVIYQKLGYSDPSRPYYMQELLPGVRLIGLNSNHFDDDGQLLPYGQLDEAQWRWLDDVLADVGNDLILVMVHHNVIEHLPGQSHHSMGQRYMLQNAPDLLARLKAAGVPLIFTGHLHVQDIAYWQGIYEITTGSLVSYPHPYRLLNLRETEGGDRWLDIETHWIESVPGWDDLKHHSREWMGDRSFSFMLRLLTQPPLNLPPSDAEQLAPDLRHFWSDVARGDMQFEFPHFPAHAQAYFRRFGAVDSHGNPHTLDNQASLKL